MQDAKTCPYCGNPTQYVDSSKVYGRSFGMIYLCEPCKAWVGVHKGTNKALGILANAELRELKKQAHEYFDPLWQRKMKQGYSKGKARRLAYQWLSEEMGTDICDTHIGMFNVTQCKRVIALCKRYHHEPTHRNSPDC